MLLLAIVPAAYADTFNGEFNTALSSGESLLWQDVGEGINVTFAVMSGTWSSSAVMNCTDAGGSLNFTATSSGTLFVGCTDATASIVMNGVTFTGGPQAFTAGNTYYIRWIYGAAPLTPTPTPTPLSNLPQLNMDWLWVYLFNGDFLGFFQALFLNAFGLLDLVYAAIAALFLVPLYLRTKSLLVVSIAWILIGGFYIAMFASVSVLAVLFVALGIGGLLYRIATGNDG